MLNSDEDWNSQHVPVNPKRAKELDELHGYFGSVPTKYKRHDDLICDRCRGKFPYSPNVTTCLPCVEDRRREWVRDNKPDNLFSPEGLRWAAEATPRYVGTARQIMAAACGINIQYFNHFSDDHIEAIIRDAGSKALMESLND